MAEADFEIDFYGDSVAETQTKHDDAKRGKNEEQEKHEDNLKDEQATEHGDQALEHEDVAPKSETSQSSKRKPEEDNRPIDPGATAAVMISELNWWTTDDDIRGWIEVAGCEDDVKELTFSEHKVNGKSKGQAYIEFQSRQAATAAKRHLDQIANTAGQPTQKKMSATYWNPGVNPFRTLPKDAPARVKEQPRAVPSGPFNDRGNFAGGFRGRGNFNTGRGNIGPGNFNRNFHNNTNNMGFTNMGGGFNGPMGGGGGGFNFANRAGMMGGGMRGGPGGMRGGRGGNMMGMPPMGGMAMGMPSNMGMMGMGGGIPGFPGMNAGFNGGGFGFGQNHQGGGGGNGDWGNPHGAKRPRPE